LHVITGLTGGGAEGMLAKLLAAEENLRAEAAVVCLGVETPLAKKIQGLGVPVHCLHWRPGLGQTSLRASRELLGLRRRYRPQIVQGWMYHGSLAAQMAGFGAPVPVLWNIRQSLDLKQEKRSTAAVVRLLSILSRRPAGIIYNSHAGARSHEAIGFSRARTQVIGNGFDTQRYQPDASARNWLRSSLGLAPDTPLIGMLARMDPMKGHSVFLRAAARVRQSCPEVHFVLAGARVSATHPALAPLLQTLGLASCVHCLGERCDGERIWAGLDLATSSSVMKEGFSNSIGEAMACGVPCVATDVGDAAVVVGSAGTVVAPDDSEALAAAWGAWLRAGGGERQRCGARARARIEGEYSIGRVAAQYQEYYGRMAAS
jgi:glycosyltransferase involved in cell wall biosynthesis